jgi:hypothetical protein
MKVDHKRLLLIAYAGIAVSYILMFYSKYKESKQ